MSRKVLIIQPHSDDALFDCAHILFSPEYDVNILTVENDERRIKEDEKLYSFLNIPLQHLNVEFKDDSYYGYKKLYKEVNIENSYKYLIDYFGKQTVNEITESLRAYLEDYFKKNKLEEYYVLVPWGIGHPFHLFVRDIVSNCISSLYYYRDFTESYKKRAQSQVEKQLKEYKLISSTPVESFCEIKWKLASKFYRSQSGFLFYEQNYIKKNLPEEIYLKKDDILPF